MKLHITPATADAAVASADAQAFLNVLQALPHGVEGMSPEVPGLVETSTNLAMAEIRDGVARVNMLTRSSSAIFKAMFVSRIEAIFRLAGFEPKAENDYVGWDPRRDSPIVSLSDDTYLALFGKRTDIVAVHAGLECGVIGATYPHLDMVSFGPTIRDPHTPKEHVNVPSVEKFWSLLTGVLAKV